MTDPTHPTHPLRPLRLDHLTCELADHEARREARGGLGVAVARLVEQLADAGARSRVLMPAGAHAAGVHARAWGRIAALPVEGRGADRIASLTDLAQREREHEAASVFVAHDHECAAAAVLARRSRPNDRVVLWLHSLYDTPHPAELPEHVRSQLRGDSVVASALEIADLVVTSAGVLADARALDWPPRMRATQTTLLAAAERGCVLTVEANACLPASLPSQPLSRPARPRVLLAARPGVHKGAGVFIEIAAALAHLDVEFIGLGDPEAGGLTREMPGVDRIEWLDWQTPESFWSLLRGATCVLMPSVSEGFGLAAAEADAIGVPVIYSDVGGLRSLPTSARATSIGLTPAERRELYRLWGDLIGSNAAGAWAAWTAARPRLDALIERWIEHVRRAVRDGAVASTPASIVARTPPSPASWGARLLTALGERPQDPTRPVLPSP